jgi:predicted transcriptional regulator
MDIQATKAELMQLLLQTEDISILEKIKNIFKTEKKDWWDELSKEQQNSIDEGFAEIDRGEFMTWEDLKREIKSKKNI